MWGFEHEGVMPDLMTLSKHFGGGIAISAVVTTDALEQQAIDAGFQYSHSHSADPLACTAALATLETIEDEGLVERARAIEARWRSALRALQAEYDCIADLRGRGVLQALELQAPDGGPGYALGPLIASACLERGLLFSVRRRGAVLRFTVPFSTTDDQMDRAAEILRDAFRAARAGVDWTAAPIGP
jgi:2,2-dialkylglycine decarboxylase (pyruvate)